MSCGGAFSTSAFSWIDRAVFISVGLGEWNLQVKVVMVQTPFQDEDFFLLNLDYSCAYCGELLT